MGKSYKVYSNMRLKPTILRTSKGNVSNLSKLKQIIKVWLTLSLQVNKTFQFIISKYFINLYLAFQGQKHKISHRRVATSPVSNGPIGD